MSDMARMIRKQFYPEPVQDANLNMQAKRRGVTGGKSLSRRGPRGFQKTRLGPILSPYLFLSTAHPDFIRMKIRAAIR